MPLARIECERRGTIGVASVVGEIDISNTGDVMAGLADVLHGGDDGLVVDVSELAYLDSSAVHGFVQLARNLKTRRQQLRIAAPDGSPAARIFTLVEISALAPLHESVDHAVAGLAAARAAEVEQLGGLDP